MTKITMDLDVDLKGLDAAIQQSQDKVDAVRSGTKQINTQLRYNWIQWQQLMSTILTQFGDTQAARIAMQGIEIANLFDFSRRITLEISAAISTGNFVGATALIGILATTVGLRIAAEVRKREMERIEELNQQHIQALNQYQGMM